MADTVAAKPDVPPYLVDVAREHLFTALLSATLLFGLVFALIAILVTLDDKELIRKVLTSNVSPFRFPVPFGQALWVWMSLCALALGGSFISLFWPKIWIQAGWWYNLTLEISVIGSLCVILLLAPRVIVYLQRKVSRLPVPGTGPEQGG